MGSIEDGVGEEGAVGYTMEKRLQSGFVYDLSTI